MNFQRVKAEYWSDRCIPIEEHLAKCARVCYASDKTTDAKKFYNKLITNGHISMLRHISRYFIIPTKDMTDADLETIYSNPYITSISYNKKLYMSTNEQFIKNNPWFYEAYEQYEIDINIAHLNSTMREFGILRYTFCIETGIDISRELNRTSPNNIAEQSTRYVDFIKKLGISFKKCHWMYFANWYQTLLYKSMAKMDEWFYKISRSKYGLNLKPEDARWCLFLDTKTKVVYTYSIREWKNIFKLRYFGTTGKPHPDAKDAIACVFHYLSNEEGYNLYI